MYAVASQAVTVYGTKQSVVGLQVQRCSLELTLHSLLHASVGLSEHGPQEFLSDSNVFVVYLEHMVSHQEVLYCLLTLVDMTPSAMLLALLRCNNVWHWHQSALALFVVLASSGQCIPGVRCNLTALWCCLCRVLAMR